MEKQGRTTVNLAHIRELRKRATVAERDVHNPVVCERRERVDDGRFLAAAWATRGDERARKLACQGTCGPELACPVPECLSRGIRSLSTTTLRRYGEKRLSLPSTARGSYRNEWECQTGRRRTLSNRWGK